ncbi:MAG TPA: UDP-glucose 4-epimerase GalE, partial [Saprospiraceae bacterium]|nr:UDP-glucose 4-epimerase GalE [Saprospiraceae bacterium]
IITETAIGKRNKITVFGDDYDTRDGSCIRDYIHIMDLANAHTKSLKFVEKNNLTEAEVFNVGIGAGVSVLEAINAFLNATQQPLNYEIGSRRPGDVIAIYANYEKAKAKLGWEPQFGIEDIMKSAWEWERVRNGE